jgi:hypothetical protein
LRLLAQALAGTGHLDEHLASQYGDAAFALTGEQLAAQRLDAVEIVRAGAVRHGHASPLIWMAHWQA